MSEHFPIIAIEGILVFGGALAFGWWQFRDLDREAAKRKAAEEIQAVREPRATSNDEKA